MLDLPGATAGESSLGGVRALGRMAPTELLDLSAGVARPA